MPSESTSCSWRPSVPRIADEGEGKVAVPHIGSDCGPQFVSFDVFGSVDVWKFYVVVGESSVGQIESGFDRKRVQRFGDAVSGRLGDVDVDTIAIR